MKRVVGNLLALTVLAVALPVLADPQPKVYTLKPVEIVGRVQNPVAAIEVRKAALKLAPAELRQPFVDRIEQSVHSTSF